MEDCLFCKIAKKELPSTIVYEDDMVIAFKDIHPVAPVHILVIPKAHIKNMNEITEENKEVFARIFMAIAKLAKEYGIAEDGYRVISNCGHNGGQVVDHQHFHLIGGVVLGPKLVK